MRTIPGIKDAPVYLLCHGAYVASDFQIIKAYPNKKFKWGYFPEVKEYNRNPFFLRKLHLDEQGNTWCQNPLGRQVPKAEAPGICN